MILICANLPVYPDRCSTARRG